MVMVVSIKRWSCSVISSDVVSNQPCASAGTHTGFPPRNYCCVLSLLPAANVGFDAQRKTVEQLGACLRVYRLDVHRQHHHGAAVP